MGTYITTHQRIDLAESHYECLSCWRSFSWCSLLVRPQRIQLHGTNPYKNRFHLLCCSWSCLNCPSLFEVARQQSKVCLCSLLGQTFVGVISLTPPAAMESWSSRLICQCSQCFGPNIPGSKGVREKDFILLPQCHLLHCFSGGSIFFRIFVI